THQFTQAEIIPSDLDNYLSAMSVAWNADGTQLAVMQLFNSEGTDIIFGAVEIFDTQTWLVERTLQYDEIVFPAPSLAWNSTQNLIAFAQYFCTNDDCRYGNLRAYFYVGDALTGQTQSWGEDVDNIYDLQWSPDGTKLAVAGSHLKIYDTSSAQLLPGWQPLLNDSRKVAWSADSQRLLNITAIHQVQIYNVNQATLLNEFDLLSFSEGIRAAYWLDQDQKLFVGGSSGNLSVWSTDFECTLCPTPTPE
ncbi:MAG TPA: WD40 repeat domain-containing protein, partial [Phototrophicaceae bacterium]|nr:WD40 repeat domain-containing protein [Phototrophicaceae bacterium]